MAWQKNIKSIAGGNYNSLSGAAAENLFFARAQIAGFPCLSKEWRDLGCDGAVLSGNALYRVEIKGSVKDSFNVTHGGRSGKQINREVNKERALSVEDCDFVVCVDINNGDCYIVPIDVVVIYGRSDMRKNSIKKYREKWQLFLSGEDRLSEEEIKNGLLQYPLEEIEQIAERFNIELQDEVYKPEGTTGLKLDPSENRRELLIVRIWEHLANRLVEGQDINEKQ